MLTWASTWAAIVAQAQSCALHFAVAPLGLIHDQVGGKPKTGKASFV